MSKVLEFNDHFEPSNDIIMVRRGAFWIPPPLGHYWLVRVHLCKDQYIIGFPKMGSIGVGFYLEENYNTNLPVKCSPEEIYEHIKCNKKYTEIAKEECIEAIKLIQQAATEWLLKNPSSLSPT